MDELAYCEGQRDGQGVRIHVQVYPLRHDIDVR
jgi:hypothetical protein